MNKTEQLLRKRILKTESNWVHRNNTIDKMVKKGMVIIEGNLEAGNINTVNEMIIAEVAFHIIDQYH